MRRKLAAVLCTLLCLTAFTGCSVEEVGYLQMSVDMMNGMKVSETKGEADITLDFDAMKTFASDAMLASGMTQEDVDAAMAGMTDFDGKKNVKLNYTMLMNMDDMSFMFDMDAKYKNQEYSFGRWYYGTKDGVYVSTETVWSAYRLMRDMTDVDTDSYFFSDEFAKEWKSMLDRDQYICVLDMKEDLGLTQEELDALIPTDGYKNVYDAAVNMYKNGFSGFSTGMVTRIQNGYRVEATGTEVGQMLVSLLDYMAQNPEPVINALEEYLKVTMQASGATEAEIADLTSSMQAAREDVEAFRTVLADVKNAVETGMQNETVAALLDGFHYTSEFTKVNDRYYGSENYQMAYKGSTMCAITSSMRMEEARGSVVFPSISVRPDAITTELETLTDKYNPVTGVSATWYYDEPTAFLTEERAEPVYWGGSTSPIVEYVVQDGRIYLPLRSICDMLGETVTWDQATKTASVVQGETVVPMDSILVDSTSYIGVRGFEALGYQVTYTNTDGEHVATIVK